MRFTSLTSSVSSMSLSTPPSVAYGFSSRWIRPCTQASAPDTGGMLMYSGGPSRSKNLPLLLAPVLSRVKSSCTSLSSSA